MTDASSRQEPDTGRQTSTNSQWLPSTSASDCTSNSPSASSFGAGLPPVPNKLVKRIQDDEFIDMSELTIDRLSMSSPDETSKPSHSKRRPVTSIIEWTQCFTNYIAILGQAQPERISDLLGYQHLILEAHLEYAGDGWAVYDRRFRQIAATRLGTPWARRDGDLWNMAFASSQRRPYCQHCFGSTHSSEQCSGAPDTSFSERKALTQTEDLPGMELHTVFVPRLSVHPCLFNLLQRPTLEGQQPQIHSLSKKCQSMARAPYTTSDGDTTPISTLRIY